MSSSPSRRLRVGGTLVALVAGMLAGPALAVAPATAAETQTPTVSVSRTAFLPDEVAEVTVRGTGFDPDLATATRPPLAGKAGGVYIAFSRFADDWRPSDGHPSSARPTDRSKIKWAVLAEDIATIGGPEAGGIELKPDGSFVATLTIDKSLADDLSQSIPSGRYGVYTYPGGAAEAPLYETYTPITFVPSSTTLTLPKSRVFGRALPAAVTVSAEGATPTGKVEVLRGAQVVGTATLANGRARLDLGGDLAARKKAHSLTARYLGDATVSPSASTAAAVKVTKAPAKVAAKVAKKRVKRGKRVRLAIRVGSPVKGVRPTAGKVRVKMRGFSKVVKINKAGKARVVLPARKRAGKFKVVVTYRGAANFKAARTRVVQRVVR